MLKKNKKKKKTCTRAFTLVKHMRRYVFCVKKFTRDIMYEIEIVSEIVIQESIALHKTTKSILSKTEENRDSRFCDAVIEYKKNK